MNRRIRELARRAGSGVLVCAALVAVPAAAAAAGVPAASSDELTLTSGYTYVPNDDPQYEGEVTTGAVLKNPTDKVARDTEVKFTFVDASGKRSESYATVSVPYILPGQEVVVGPAPSVYDIGAPTKLVAEVTTAPRYETTRQFATTIKTRSGFEVTTRLANPGDQLIPQFADLRLVDTGEGQAHIVGTMTGPENVDLAGLDVHCIALRGGQPIAGGQESVSSLPAGATVAIGPSLGMVAGGGIAADSLQCSAWLAYGGAAGPRADRIAVSSVGHSVFDPGYSPEYTMGAVVKNTSKVPAYDVSGDFDVYDANGRVLGRALNFTQIPYLAPGAESYVSATIEMDELDGTLGKVEVRGGGCFVPHRQAARSSGTASTPGRGRSGSTTRSSPRTTATRGSRGRSRTPASRSPRRASWSRVRCSGATWRSAASRPRSRPRAATR